MGYIPINVFTMRPGKIRVAEIFLPKLKYTFLHKLNNFKNTIINRQTTIMIPVSRLFTVYQSLLFTKTVNMIFPIELMENAFRIQHMRFSYSKTSRVLRG